MLLSSGSEASLTDNHQTVFIVSIVIGVIFIMKFSYRAQNRAQFHLPRAPAHENIAFVVYSRTCTLIKIYSKNSIYAGPNIVTIVTIQ